MASTVYFCVFEGASEVALGDPIQEGIIDFSGGEAKSAAITGTKRIRRRVRIMADDDCFVAWGDGVTALNDGTLGRPMGSENPEYHDIEAGHTISAIARA